MGDLSSGLTVGVSGWRDSGAHACLQEVGSKKEEGKAEKAHFLFSRWRDLESVEMPRGQSSQVERVGDFC